MKLISYLHEGRERVGAVVGDAIVDLTLQFPTMLAMIEAGEPGLAAAKRTTAEAGPSVKLGAVSLLAPLPKPVQMRDCLVFEEHLGNSAERIRRLHGYVMAIPPVWYDQPIYYKCNRLSVVGPEATIVVSTRVVPFSVS